MMMGMRKKRETLKLKRGVQGLREGAMNGGQHCGGGRVWDCKEKEHKSGSRSVFVYNGGQ